MGQGDAEGAAQAAGPVGAAVRGQALYRLHRAHQHPLPDAVQVPPPAPTQVHVQVSEAGNVSATVAPVTASGPTLLAVTV